MRLFTFLLLFGLGTVGAFDAFSQSASAVRSPREITGVVSDDKQEAIPGVTVVEKGTNNGTVTDAAGKYSIRVTGENPVLVFSLIGAQTREIPVGNLLRLNVTMSEDTQQLEAVVVVGYGAQTRTSITGAVSTVDVKRLEQSSASNLSSALAGRLAGLTSLQTGGGQPGSDDATLYLRGVATFNESSPLFIVDGVPRDDIRQINPTEIASISTLKDASATAVFGVRGANGAIIITTKRGEKGKAKVRLRAERGYSSFIFEPERVHSVEFLRLRNEASVNDGLGVIYGEDVIAKFENPLAGLDPAAPDYQAQAAKMQYMYPDHDYYREFIARYAPETRISADISGGGDKLSYYINTGFLHQGGNLKTEPKSKLGYDPSSHMQRYNFRSNLDYQVSETVKAYLNLSSNIEKINKPYSGISTLDMILNAQHIWPITPGPVTIEGYGAPSGQVVEIDYLTNPTFESMNRRGYTNESRSSLAATLGMEKDLKRITPGLRISGLASINTRSRSLLVGNKKELTYLASVDYKNDELQFVIHNDQETLMSLTKTSHSRYSVNLQARINYNRKFNKHNVGAMILAQRDTWELESGEIPADSEIPFNMIGLSARTTYDYDNRYFAEINLGYNGSEQFAPSNRFGFFPAVSGGWVVSNESFLMDNRVLTYLKFRASYGKVGNDKIGRSRFLYMDDMAMDTGTGFLPSLGNGKGIRQGLLGNPNIQWEVAAKQNYGIDVNFFKNLRVSLDYYHELRDNILISRQSVPAIQGVQLGNIPKVNMGKIKNRGFEIEINYNKTLNNGLTLGIQGNYAYNKNTVLFSDEPILDEGYVRRYRSTGYALGQLFGYKIDWGSNGGYWISQEEIDNANLSYDFGFPRPGDFRYIDINNDGVINEKDMVPIGYSQKNPRDTFGFTFSADFKGFDFMIFFQGVGRYSKLFEGQGAYESSKSGMFFGYHKNAWTEERFNNGEEITYPALTLGTSTNHVANEFFIMDRSYVRLRNIELGYSLPRKLLDRIGGISGIRVYVGAQNLFTWHNLRMNHIDPDLDNSVGYPITKMLNFGCNINF